MDGAVIQLNGNNNQLCKFKVKLSKQDVWELVENTTQLLRKANAIIWLVDYWFCVWPRLNGVESILIKTEVEAEKI